MTKGDLKKSRDPCPYHQENKGIEFERERKTHPPRTVVCSARGSLKTNNMINNCLVLLAYIR